MTTRHLLDANVLIALVVQEHEHHGRVADWAADDRLMGICPIVEGALVRFLVRVGVGAETAKQLLEQLNVSPRFEFWPDAVSYRAVDLGQVIGHRQVTDAYLVALAQSQGATVATLDAGLATVAPDAVELIR